MRAWSNSLCSLPYTFRQLQRLASLTLRSNKFEHVPSQLSSLAALEHLNMADNRLAHMDESIPALKYLVLDDNDFVQIDSGIVRCAGLHLLSLKRNRLGHISQDIGQLISLRSLFLSDNPIVCIPVELGQLSQLLRLSLSSTNIQTVPLAVACLPSLQAIELEDCTELDSQLSNAYKTNGRAGLKDYLKRQASTETSQSVNVASNCVDLRANSKRCVRTVATESILPADPPKVISPPPPTSPNERPTKAKKPVL